MVIKELQAIKNKTKTKKTKKENPPKPKQNKETPPLHPVQHIWVFNSLKIRRLLHQHHYAGAGNGELWKTVLSIQQEKCRTLAHWGRKKLLR